MPDFEKALAQNLPVSEQKSKMDLLSNILQAGSNFGTLEHVFWVPGRIEVLGKHTDYAGGRSLLAATTRGFFFAVYPRQDRQIQAVDAVTGERMKSRVEPDVSPTVGQWSNYAETVFRRVARNFPGGLKGANIAFGSDLPRAAGMSSSSAMIIGFFLALDAVNGLKNRSEYLKNIQTSEDLSGYLGTNENGQTFGSLVGDKGVGTFGGSEDHTAIMNCKLGSLSQYRYCPVEFERGIPLSDDYVFAIGASGVVADKTGTAMEKYNRASRLASEALVMWNKASGANDPHLAGAVERVGADAIRVGLVKANHSEFSALELVERFN
ncbi:MAG: galactokinase family protein, partial [Candidatus Latescibacteria bacterium]|nr:galactokinase family protein [Candidatus Latescibacterota bacterium]